jgi:O-antigen/teichoic acid export membrane protein
VRPSINGATLRASTPTPAIASARSYLRSLEARIQKLIVIVRLLPFDTSTEAGRSKERYRRAALAGIAGGLSKGIRLLNTIVAVPLTISYLGQERFGLWMTLSSVIVLAFGFADLGLGCVLQNAISYWSGKNNREEMQRDLSSGFCLLLAGPLAMLAVFLALNRSIPWERIFNLRTSLAAAEAGPAAAIFIISYLAAMPLSVAGRIQVGFQEGFRANIWDAASGSLGAAGTLIAAFFHASLPILVLASAGTPLIALAANSANEFSWRRPWLRPRWRWFEWRRGRVLIGSGVQFLMAGIGIFALMGAPFLVVGHRFGAAESGVYALTYKILTVPITLVGLVWSPLWPAYADAHARNDLHWIRSTLRRTGWFTARVLTPAMIALALCTPWLVCTWTGGRLRPSLAEACATSLFVVANSLLFVYSVPLSACGRARVPGVVLPITGAMAFLPLMAPASKFPVAAVPLWVAACEALAVAAFMFSARTLCNVRLTVMNAVPPPAHLTSHSAKGTEGAVNADCENPHRATCI